MAITRDLETDWGVTGLTGTLAYRVLSSAGATLIARTTTGVSESPAGSGRYHVQVTTWDPTWVGRVIWDDGSVTPGHNSGESFDAVGVVTEYANGQDPATLVLDPSMDDHDEAGSVGHRIKTGADAAVGMNENGVVLAGSEASLIADAVGPEVAATLLSILTNNVAINGESPQRVIELVRKDTYIGYGREFTFVKHATETWPNDLTGWTVTFTANRSPFNEATGSQTGVASVTLAGTVTTPTGATQTVTLAPGTTQTNALAIGVGAKGYYWDIVATLATNRATLRGGVMNVRENQTV